MKVKNESDTDMLTRLMAEGFTSIEASLESLAQEVRGIHHRIDKVLVPTLDDHARRIKDLELAR